jgi:hypothetical protein
MAGAAAHTSWAKNILEAVATAPRILQRQQQKLPLSNKWHPQVIAQNTPR